MCRVRPLRRAARRARPACIALGLAVAISGCGRSNHQRVSELRFEDLPDSADLARGAPILDRFEPYRMAGGAMRVRGAVHLPDGTRLQVAVLDARNGATLQTLQVTVQDRTFETDPFMTERGPLPRGTYRFDLLAYFDPAWQTDRVMLATRGGRTLHGPGIQRTQNGVAFHQVEERTL